MILIPEKILFDFLNSIIQHLIDDFKHYTDEKKTLLYRLYEDNEVGGIEYFVQAKEIFLRTTKDTRKIETRMFFDSGRAHLPTIHINLPSETSGMDGIGVDVGYRDFEVDEQAKELQEVHTRAFEANYNIIITSDNTMEVLIIYHTIRALMIALLDVLDLQGLRNPKLGGQDLQINPELVPPHIFLRAISLKCFYEVNVPTTFRKQIIEKFEFIQDMLIET